MDQNSIDASLGLELALELLEQHQRTGELRGNISITQFLMTKHYQCIIQIEHGRVLSCILIDEKKQERPAGKEYLTRIDEKSGPFDWKFYARDNAPVPTQASPTRPLPAVSMPLQVSPVRDDSIPVRLTPELQLSWLTTWQENEIRLLHQIFALANGQRTIRDIKTILFRFPPGGIEKAFVFLIAMKQIEIRRK